VSQPKLYDDQGVWKCLYFEGSTNGWVKWSDYAALAAENERLRKAGDDLAVAWARVRTYYHSWDVAVKAWDAAKEGRDAK